MHVSLKISDGSGCPPCVLLPGSSGEPMRAEYIRIIPQVLWFALVAVVVFRLRSDLGSLVRAVVERSRACQKVSRGPSALEGVLEARVSAAEVVTNQIALVTMPQPEPSNAELIQPTPTLIERADAYREADKIRPLDARLKRKDELAAQM